jgi:ABC-type nitrate/sulfonate/bicarbonate transport system substrate-binding protein
VTKLRSRTTDEVTRERRKLDGILPEGIDRRKFLSTVAGGLIMGTAGCAAGDSPASNATPSGSNSTPSGSTSSPSSGGGQTSSGGSSGNERIYADAKFRAPWKAEPDWLVQYVAQERDFWEDRGIVPPEVARGYGSSDTSKRVGTGKLEFGNSSAVAQASMLSQLDGAPYSLVGTDKPRSQVGLFYKADGPISGPQDLDGETVALTNNPFIVRAWKAYQALSGAPSNVQTQQGTEATQLSSLKQDKVAAVIQTVGDVPDYNAAMDSEVQFDPLYKYRPVYGYTIIANDEFVEANMEYSTRILEGYSHAHKWTLLSVEEALQILRQDVNPSLQLQELETQRDALRISLVATCLTDGYRENGAAYLNDEVTQNTFDTFNEVIEGEVPTDLDEITNFDLQENAELAQFSSDEWSQLEEFAGDSVQYFE